VRTLGTWVCAIARRIYNNCWYPECCCEKWLKWLEIGQKYVYIQHSSSGMSSSLQCDCQ
jgi:hypothetical protein